MIPSQRGYLLLILGILIAPVLALVFNQQISLIATLIYDAVILLFIFLDSWQVRKHRAEITRQPLNRLSIGRENPVLLFVKSGIKAINLQIRDNYPPEFEVINPILKTSLPANNSTELTYNVKPSQRGEYEWGDIQVRQLGNWGLAWHQWKIPASFKVAVYPDLIGLRALTIRLTLLGAGTMTQARKFGTGTEFAELREYNSGDDLRLIDWKATARRLAAPSKMPLQIRVLEPEQEQTLMILLDRGRLMTAQVQGLKRFDWGLNAALSLAMAGLNRGDKVGVTVFDRNIAASIPPERGQSHFNKILERLTPLQPVLLEPDYVGAVTTFVKQQNRRSLVVLITDIVDSTASAELLAALVRLKPRYLPFCVTLRDPQVDHIAHNFTANIHESYGRAVALDLLAQRQVAFAKLKQKGVLVLDAPANLISDQLVERYLQLKAKNQL
ncbi:DUF58 domain-containing protein [Ancylothrix sp. C2]|uniref:DUF58 domain-containing protein n=1 Tax=Ancylothrix sp. D3o TaxID=2953691 RepID=UPI0021BB60E4|nr:DUF58 domain-containing protein [Ancylothrix sp. D3o]MCT7950650.1 DUF58 domain-containing protein [Ancylothrix sp. D3o]